MAVNAQADAPKREALHRGCGLTIHKPWHELSGHRGYAAPEISTGHRLQTTRDRDMATKHEVHYPKDGVFMKAACGAHPISCASTLELVTCPKCKRLAQSDVLGPASGEELDPSLTGITDRSSEPSQAD